MGLWIGIIVILIGVAAGFLSSDDPTLLGLMMMAGFVLLWFVTGFTQAVLGLLILRSALDIYSDQGLPAAFALGLDALVLLYVVGALLTKQSIKTDWFFWFFAVWVGFQGLSPLLLSMGGLGLDPSFLSTSIREWIRLFSLLMVYLLVMQLKDRIEPQKLVSALFLCLIVPFSIALSQIARGFVRIDGTLGHANNFSTFTILFLVLSLWKVSCAKYRTPWLILSAVIMFFLIGSKSMTGLAMLGVYTVAYFLPRLDVRYTFGGLLLSAVAIALFTMTELGRERIAELYMTPLLNREMDWSYALAIQLSDSADANSFNWRIAQWTFLLQSWSNHPLFGHGLGTALEVSVFKKEAHNDYIRFLVETGLVGFVSFILLLFAQGVRLIQLLRASTHSIAQHNLVRTLLAFFIAVVIGMLTGNIWGQTAPLFYWWTLFAVTGWDWTATSPTLEMDESASLIRSDGTFTSAREY
jgi:O-antigen ligase